MADLAAEARRRAEKSAATRAKLLDEAQKLLIERGYSATTVEAVCAGVGVTKGAFFHLFAGKDELVEAAVAAFGSRLLDGVEADRPVESHDDLVDRLLAWTGTRRFQTCLLGRMAHEAAGANARIDETVGIQLEALLAWIKASLRRIEPELSPARARARAEFVAATFEGGVLLARARRDAKLVVHCLEELRRALKAGGQR
jgi:TetR/AcrR family transcriptional repressor of nem operon